LGWICKSIWWSLHINTYRHWNMIKLKVMLITNITMILIKQRMCILEVVFQSGWSTGQQKMIWLLISLHLISPLCWALFFCFILAEDSQYCDIMEFNISTFDGEGDDEKDGVDICMYRTCYYTELDHVCMIYDQPCSHYLTSIAKNQTQVKIKVTARTIGNKYRERTEVKLKGFGISPISHTIYDNFVGQMETFDHINKWKWTVLLSIILCISLLQLKMKMKKLI